MSGQFNLGQTGSKRESVYLMLTIIFLALLSVSLVITFLNANGYTISTIDLIEKGFFEVIIQNNSLNSQTLSLILFWATPLALTGLAVAIAFHAGLFNIGGQGQMMVGGCFAGIWAAVIVPESEFLSKFTTPLFMIPSTMIMGMIGGALWAFIPGILKAKTGAHEVITTILMNIVAISFVTYLVGNQSYSPYIDRSSSEGDQRGQTPVIDKSAQIPVVNTSISNFLNYIFVVAIIVIVVMYFIIYKTSFGFQLRAVGYNKEAAETAGIKSDNMLVYAMLLSGAMAGLAGALLTQSPLTAYRFKISSISTTGFDGIAIALIGLNNPIGVGVAALFFGFLKQSRLNIQQTTTIPPDVITIFQAFIILFAAAPLIAKRLLYYANLGIERVKDSIPQAGQQEGEV